MPKYKPKPGERTDRKVNAGILLLADPKLSQAEVLKSVGYAPTTASKPKANGISAEHCVDAAIAKYPEIDPSNILKLSRRALRDRLKHLCDNPADLKKSQLGQLAKTLDILERHHGARDADPTAAGREFVDRAAWLQGVVERMRELRGSSNNDALSTAVDGDAVVVEAERVRDSDGD